MKHGRREAARARLDQLVSDHPLTRETYVRTWDNHVIIGGRTRSGPTEKWKPTTA